MQLTRIQWTIPGALSGLALLVAVAGCSPEQPHQNTNDGDGLADNPAEMMSETEMPEENMVSPENEVDDPEGQDPNIQDRTPPSEWENNLPEEETNVEEMKEMLSISMAFEGLEPLGDEFVYEGWLITDDGPVSSGRFQIDEEGLPYPDTFVLDEGLDEMSFLFVLTIEPAENDDPAPSPVHILAGEVNDGVFDLSIDHEAALGTDFTGAEGAFILKTPSSADTDEDDNQGVWWVDPTAGPGAGLHLPELPEGWAYEGWVVGADGPISTGTFLYGDMADSDGAGDTAGPDGTPPFPGQDFIFPALDLIGFKAVISVEPVPDNSPHPFLLKPLFGDIEDLGGGVLQPMENKATEAAAPTGQTWFVYTSTEQ